MPEEVVTIIASRARLGAACKWPSHPESQPPSDRKSMPGHAACGPEPNPPDSSIKASADALKAPRCLLEHPFDYSRIVITVSEVVIQGRETVLLAFLLHLVKLLDFELVVADHSPIIRC